MTVCQKWSMILENKAVQKLKLENNVFNKKWSPKLILRYCGLFYARMSAFDKDTFHFSRVEN
jgi:hypothetical protein